MSIRVVLSDTRLGNLVWMHQFTSRGARPREIQASVAQSAVRSWQMSAGAGLLGLRQLSQRVHYRGLQAELRGPSTQLSGGLSTGSGPDVHGELLNALHRECPVYKPRHRAGGRTEVMVHLSFLLD